VAFDGITLGVFTLGSGMRGLASCRGAGEGAATGRCDGSARVGAAVGALGA